MQSQLEACGGGGGSRGGQRGQDARRVTDTETWRGEVEPGRSDVLKE